jgi:sodium/potassium-transporting ATPase subunit alpha
LGLIGLEDPPKDGVEDAVKKIRSARIKTVMITGDNPMTAEVIKLVTHRQSPARLD